VIILVALTGGAAAAQTPTKEVLIARAKSFELDTPYVPPPGDPLTHHAAGFAKVMCSDVFLTGLAPDFAAENVGFFTAPYGLRARFGKPVINRPNKEVHVTLPSGVTRTAKYLGSQGCVTLPIGQSAVNFEPVAVKSRLPDPATQAWPMGDMLPMGKSVTAALLGILVKDGVYDLDQLAPIPEWQTPGDARAKVRVADLLRMSSGLRIRAPQDPDYDPTGPYPDHVTAIAMASQHGRTLSQHRSGPDQLPDPARCRKTRRGVSLISSAGALRQARHPYHGHRN
jgi:hypothetical protein